MYCRRGSTDKTLSRLRRDVPPSNFLGVFLEGKTYLKEADGQFDAKKKVVRKESYDRSPQVLHDKKRGDTKEPKEIHNKRRKRKKFSPKTFLVEPNSTGGGLVIRSSRSKSSKENLESI